MIIDSAHKNVPDYILTNLRFADVFELEEIQQLQDLFADATGVAAQIIHPDGTPITRPANFCRLCKIIRKTEKGAANCCFPVSATGGITSNKPIVTSCLSGGIWDAKVDIVVDGQHIASWLIGQVRNDNPDLPQVIRLAEEIGVETDDLLEAFEEVPRMSLEQFGKVAKMLFSFVNELSGKAFRNLQLKLQMAEKEKAMALLSEHEEFLSIMLHSIGDGVISTDINGLIISINPAAEHLCGWTSEEAVGQPLNAVFTIVHSDTLESVADPVKKVLESGQIIGLANHTILVSRNGEEFQIADSAGPIKNKEGLISGVVLVFSDISEKHRSQEIIRKSEEKFHSLYLNMSEGAALHELIYNHNGEPEDYVIIETNPAFEKQLGIDRESVIGKTSREAYQVSEPPYFEIYKQVANTGEPVVFDTYFPPLAKHYSISVYSPYPGSFATIFEDITARKQDEMAVLQTNDALAFLAQYTGIDKENDFFKLLAQYLAKALEADFVCIDSLEGDGLNARTVAVWCDGKFEDNVIYALKDTPCGEVVGKTVCCFPASVCQFFPRDSVLQDLKAESYVGVTLWSHSGKAIGLIAVIKRNQLYNQRQAEELLKIVAVRAAGEMERIIAEQALVESERLYRSILNASPDAIVTTNLEGKILMVSPGTVSMFGCENSEQLLGLLLFDFMFPEDRELAVSNIMKVVSGSNPGAKEYRGILLDGTLFDIEISAECIRDLEGQPLQVVIIIRDITTLRMSAQEIKIKNELLLKLNTEKDKFFSIIAHDLRSPFNGFLGLTQIMAEELPTLTMTEIQNIALSMRNSATNLFRLLENLLQWSRIQQGLIPFNPHRTSFHSIVLESTAIITESARGKQIEINYDYPDDLVVYADVDMLQTIIRNLVSNAVKFTHKGGKVWILAEEIAGHYISIAIQDTGIGMSEEMIENLFRLDLQSNRKGTEGEPSTGLGLMLCKDFVEKHGGTIWVESKEGIGSTYHYTLPLNY